MELLFQKLMCSFSHKCKKKKNCRNQLFLSWAGVLIITPILRQYSLSVFGIMRPTFLLPNPLIFCSLIGSLKWKYLGHKLKCLHKSILTITLKVKCIRKYIIKKITSACVFNRNQIKCRNSFISSCFSKQLFYFKIAFCTLFEPHYYLDLCWLHRFKKSLEKALFQVIFLRSYCCVVIGCKSN